MSNKKDKKVIKKENQDWASKKAKQLGVSRNLIIGIIAGA